MFTIGYIKKNKAWQAFLVRPKATCRVEKGDVGRTSPALLVNRNRHSLSSDGRGNNVNRE